MYVDVLHIIYLHLLHYTVHMHMHIEYNTNMPVNVLYKVAFFMQTRSFLAHI